MVIFFINFWNIVNSFILNLKMRHITCKSGIIYFLVLFIKLYAYVGCIDYLSNFILLKLNLHSNVILVIAL